MTDTDRPRLRDVLVADYEQFFRRLSLRLRSPDSAAEALHETYLRVGEPEAGTAVQSPKDYIFRAAINIAKNRRKAESYRSTCGGLETVLDIADDAPDPARVVEARSEIEALKHALAELPPRRRAILNAISIDGLPPREVAERLNVSLRTVETDLQQALQHCAKRLKHKLNRRSGPRNPW